MVPACIVASELLSTLPNPTFAFVVPAWIVASDELSTLPKPTLALVVFAFRVFEALNVVDPICNDPLNPAEPSAATKKFFDSILPLDKVILVPVSE